MGLSSAQTDDDDDDDYIYMIIISTMITVVMTTSIIYHYFTSFISLLLLMFPMLPAPHFLDAHVLKQCIPARVREWIITVPHEVDTVDIMIIHLWISIIHYYPLLMNVWVNYVWFHYLW